MASLIKHDGTTSEVEPSNGTDFGLYELYKLLDCQTIEHIALANGKSMICDEEAKMRNDWHKRINVRATQLFKDGRMTRSERMAEAEVLRASGTFVIDLIDDDDSGDSIVGNVLVCEPNQFR